MTKSPNPYQARAVNSKKNSITEMFLFHFSTPKTGTPTWFFSQARQMPAATWFETR